VGRGGDSHPAQAAGVTVFIHIVRFKPRLPAADVLKTAVYVWESRKAFEAFGASELAR